MTIPELTMMAQRAFGGALTMSDLAALSPSISERDAYVQMMKHLVNKYDHAMRDLEHAILALPPPPNP